MLTILILLNEKHFAERACSNALKQIITSYETQYFIWKELFE